MAMPSASAALFDCFDPRPRMRGDTMALTYWSYGEKWRLSATRWEAMDRVWPRCSALQKFLCSVSHFA